MNAGSWACSAEWSRLACGSLKMSLPGSKNVSGIAPWQVESITFSWCDFDTALRYIQQTLRGGDDNNDFAHEVSPILQSPSEHGYCCHCR
jgi:hypothetical protein